MRPKADKLKTKLATRLERAVALSRSRLQSGWIQPFSHTSKPGRSDSNREPWASKTPAPPIVLHPDGADRNRTRNLFLAKELLSQLSYSPVKFRRSRDARLVVQIYSSVALPFGHTGIVRRRLDLNQHVLVSLRQETPTMRTRGLEPPIPVMSRPWLSRWPTRASPAMRVPQPRRGETESGRVERRAF